MEKQREAKIRERYHQLTELLIKEKMTISTMESATAGLVSSLITDTEGSSAVLKGAFVTYSNEAKIRCGVPAETIEEYSVYSRETAEAMARSCAKAYQADIGIGITGTMGNTDPCNPDASVPGQVYFAILVNGDCVSYERKLLPMASRPDYKMAVAGEVAEELLTRLGELSDHPSNDRSEET